MTNSRIASNRPRAARRASAAWILAICDRLFRAKRGGLFRAQRGARRGRGSVLIIVMMTLLFAAFALIVFMEKASTDLLVDQREVLTRRLRQEAYSALEVTLAVLENFRAVGNGLKSPAEGWSDPLEFAGYTPSEDRVVQISFEDESGKISLPVTDAAALANLFKNWQISQVDSDALADALMGWMKSGHTYSTGIVPDYEHREIPYEEPRRSLRSFQELAAIEKVRDVFFDKDGRPNEYWKRFTDAVSLYEFKQPNINGARPDTLAALGQYDPTQQQNVMDYLRGEGAFARQGPGFFQSAAEAQRIAVGAQGGTGAFGATISALRINVTVIDGKTQFRLSTVVAPPGGAQTVQTNATAQRTQTSASATQSSAKRQAASRATQPSRQNQPTTGARQATNSQDLKYPFSLLEIRENDVPPPISPAG